MWLWNAATNAYYGSMGARRAQSLLDYADAVQNGQRAIAAAKKPAKKKPVGATATHQSWCSKQGKKTQKGTEGAQLGSGKCRKKK